MLTVDLDRLLAAGDRVLDVGCGEGRHTHGSALETVSVVGLDADRDRLRSARDGFEAAVADAAATNPSFLQGDAYDLPFPDGAFDVVICSEVLEHLEAVERAVAELDRVLAPGGTLAVSVPRPGPERVCWALSEEYHQVEGGHVRVFEPAALTDTIEGRGLDHVDTDYAHAFHAPYWWLKCLWWERDRDGDPPLPLSAYERFLEWAEFGDHPVLDRIERALDRVLGKSLVLYFQKQ